MHHCCQVIRSTLTLPLLSTDVLAFKCQGNVLPPKAARSQTNPTYRTTGHHAAAQRIPKSSVAFISWSTNPAVPYHTLMASRPPGAYCPNLSNVTRQINTYRRRHQASNMTYNQSMATQAAAHAFSVARAGCKDLSTATGVPHGQSLSGYFSPRDYINQVECLDIVRSW